MDNHAPAITKPRLVTKEYRTLFSIKGPLIFVEGIADVAYNEMVEIIDPGNVVRLGQVLEIDHDRCRCGYLLAPQVWIWTVHVCALLVMLPGWTVPRRPWSHPGWFWAADGRRAANHSGMFAGYQRASNQSNGTCATPASSSKPEYQPLTA